MSLVITTVKNPFFDKLFHKSEVLSFMMTHLQYKNNVIRGNSCPFYIYNGGEIPNGLRTVVSVDLVGRENSFKWWYDIKFYLFLNDPISQPTNTSEEEFLRLEQMIDFLLRYMKEPLLPVTGNRNGFMKLSPEYALHTSSSVKKSSEIYVSSSLSDIANRTSETVTEVSFPSYGIYAIPLPYERETIDIELDLGLEYGKVF